MTKLRVVLDTNIYLSAIIYGGNPRHILDLALNRRLITITSPGILLELSEKLNQKFGWSKNQIVLTIQSIGKIAKIVCPARHIKVIKDKTDNKIIEAGIDGSADYIVTGDNHLLDLGRYQGIRIVTPAQFLKIYINNDS